MSLQMSLRNVHLLTPIEGTAPYLVSSSKRLRLRTKSEMPKNNEVVGDSEVAPKQAPI